MPKIILGTTLDGSESIAMSAMELTRHMAFLGGTGSGKTTAALNIVEQVLDLRIPVIIVDRKGDLCGYAQENAMDPAFYSKVETVVYTPGHKGGRTISIQLVPEGAADLDDVERENVAHSSAHALADMLGYKHEGKGAELRAILFKALELMLVRGDKTVTTETLGYYVLKGSTKFLNAVRHLDLGLLSKIVKDLATFQIDKGRILTHKGEPMSMDALLGLGTTGRTRLSIISTKFLGEATDFWLAQLLIEAGRWASKTPSDKLQAIFFFDEADTYLPAMKTPATKKPMEDLLKRARSAGIGLMLATQSPGDLDYKGRDNVRTWYLGRIKEEVALKKIRPIVQDDGVIHRIPAQTVGQFLVATEGHIEHIISRQSQLKTVQLAEAEILALSKRGPLGPTGHVPRRS